MTGLLFYPDHPADLAAMAEWKASCERQQEITRITGKTPMQRAMEAIDAKAFKLRRELVKRAARRYRNEPWLLDRIMPGLSMSHPSFIMVAVGQKARIPWGRIDLLGVVPTNLAGAYLHARWERRQMYRERVASAPARERPALRVVASEGECV